MTIFALDFSPEFLRSLPGSHKVTDRAVRFHQAFFDDLDELLPPERSADGMPSATDFLLYELPRLRDLLADDYESTRLRSTDGATYESSYKAGRSYGPSPCT